MSEGRVAARYAKSLLELAAEKKALEEVNNDMLLFTKVCEQNRDFVLLMKNPIVRHDKKRAVLKAVFSKAHKLTAAIFDIITRKNRESYLPAIAKEFHHQYNVLKKIEEAKVTTAVPLDAKLKKEMEALVAKISKFDKVELTEEVDPDVIGGFVLTVGDQQIDDSIQTKLKVLNHKFSHNPYVKEF